MKIFIFSSIVAITYLILHAVGAKLMVELERELYLENTGSNVVLQWNLKICIKNRYRISEVTTFFPSSVPVTCYESALYLKTKSF